MPRHPLLRWSLILAFLLVTRPRASADDISADLKLARDSVAREDYAEAIKTLDALIARHPELAELAQADSLVAGVQFQPNLVEAYALRADALWNRGEWDRSLADCDRAIRLKSADPDLLGIRGSAYLGRRDLDRATADFTAAIDQNLGGIYCYYGRAVAAILARRYDASLADLDHLWKTTREPAVLQLRAAVRFCLHDYDQALAGWTEALRLDPTNPLVWINRSAILTLMKRDAEAWSDAETAIRLDPQRAMAWFNRGSVAIHLGQYDRAIADCDEAIRLEPKWARACQSNRAVALWRKKDAAGALADLDRAANSRADDPKVDRFRAIILATAADDATRNGPLALSVATRAVEQTRRLDPAALGALAAAQAELGYYAQAVESAEAALKLPDSDPIEWRIEALGGRKMFIEFSFTDRDSDSKRRELEQAIACYRAGKPNRQHR